MVVDVLHLWLEMCMVIDQIGLPSLCEPEDKKDVPFVVDDRFHHVGSLHYPAHFSLRMTQLRDTLLHSRQSVSTCPESKKIIIVSGAVGSKVHGNVGAVGKAGTATREIGNNFER